MFTALFAACGSHRPGRRSSEYIGLSRTPRWGCTWNIRMSKLEGPRRYCIHCLNLRNIGHLDPRTNRSSAASMRRTVNAGSISPRVSSVQGFRQTETESPTLAFASGIVFDVIKDLNSIRYGSAHVCLRFWDSRVLDGARFNQQCWCFRAFC